MSVVGLRAPLLRPKASGETMTPGRRQTASCSMQFATGGEIVGLVMQIFGVAPVSCYAGWLFCGLVS